MKKTTAKTEALFDAMEKDMVHTTSELGLLHGSLSKEDVRIYVRRICVKYKRINCQYEGRNKN